MAFQTSSSESSSAELFNYLTVLTAKLLRLEVTLLLRHFRLID